LIISAALTFASTFFNFLRFFHFLTSSCLNFVNFSVFGLIRCNFGFERLAESRANAGRAKGAETLFNIQLKWKPYRKCAATARLAFNVHTAVKGLNNLFDQSQSKPASFYRPLEKSTFFCLNPNVEWVIK